MRLVWCAALVVAAAVPARAQVQLGVAFGSNMVLQRGGPMPIWGTAADGEAVVVEFNGHVLSTTASGRQWRVELPATPPGGPFTLTVTGAASRVVATNVMVGDVWVCSGQSNITFPLFMSENGAEAIATSAATGLRLLKVGYSWYEADPTTTQWTSAVAFYFGRAMAAHTGVPTGVIDASYSASSLKSWQVNGVSFLLIKPLLGLSFGGLVWYQGENEAYPEKIAGYEDDLRRLIADWRTAWGRGDFPFFVVQLANLPGAWPQWMEVRDAQLQVLDLPATSLTCLIDLPSASVHPTLKQPVGERLALAARRLTLGEPVVHMGPILDPGETEVRAGEIALAFDHVGGGLRAPTGSLAGFEIAGANLQFVPAQATLDRDRVLVAAREVAEPVAVRYAWSPVPPASLFNAEGLPASPFRFLAHRSAYGSGCGAAAEEAPRLDALGVPRLGRTLALDLYRAPASQPGILLLGTSRSSWLGVPLPASLAPLGMPGCELLVGPGPSAAFATTSGGAWRSALPVAGGPGMLGAAFYAQTLVLEPGANPAGVVASNGAAFRIGY